MSETELLDLPVEIVFKNLSFLESQDLLLLRKVCSEVKSFVDDFKEGKWTGWEVTLEDLSDYQRYLDSSLKLPNIHIIKYPEGFTTAIVQFLEHCASSIKSLRVEEFFSCETDEEFNFFCAFTNLESLEIERIRVQTKPSAVGKEFRIPPNFKTLKELYIKEHSYEDEPTEEEDYAFDLLRFCTHTPTLSNPVDIYRSLSVSAFFELVNQPERQIALQGTPIKYIDLNNHFGRLPDYDEEQSFNFLCFLKLIFDQGIQLKNINAELFQGFAQLEPPVEKALIDQTIISLIGFDADCLSFDWTNLTRLTAFAKPLSKDFKELYNALSESWFDTPAMPNLRELRLEVESSGWQAVSSLRFKAWIRIFFPGDLTKDAQRSALKELSIIFIRNVSEEIGKLLDAERILRNAPNLKKLKIQRWDTNQWGVLFKGLTKLEDLTVENCETFTDEALIGKDLDNPLFLQLKGLKKLTLRLDFMEGLTDKAFKEIFSRMNLIELKLQGGNEFGGWPFRPKPLTKVTLEGIASLARGPFATSIMKLSFGDLSLDGVSSEELERVKMLFPFYQS